MERLFAIETDHAILTWSAARPSRRPPPDARGLLRVTRLREGLVFGAGTVRAGVAEGAAGDTAIHAGPVLLEEQDYEVYARATRGARIAIQHDDPRIFAALREEEGGRVLHGIVNFGAQIGRSAFSVHVDGAPEVAFEVEVFPSKLDYMDDYRRILAEVQEIATALGLTYLSATRQAGVAVPAEAPTDLEWTLLLRRLTAELERALHHVAERPARGLRPSPAPLRAERVKRADPAIRAAVARGRGEGPLTELPDGMRLRSRLPAGRPDPTLDTPEHRWLRAQIAAIRHRLAAVRRATAEGPEARRPYARDDLEKLDGRLLALARLEPLEAATGEPPPAFTSLRLLTAPGYREAYAACVTLARGLRITGGPLDLPVKDLARLYEMWCFLVTVRVLAGVPGVELDLGDVFRVHARGLEVHLARGRESRVVARGPGGRTITVTYNPLLDHPHLLTPQRPDVLVTVEDRGWPSLHLVLDAKYRLDDRPEYVQRYGAPGPPDDALNVLHRYRDAILVWMPEPAAVDAPEAREERPKRTVVQAAAAFPYRAPQGSDFAASRLFTSLERLGVGAIPLLPGDTQLLERWLSRALLGGAWALSDHAIRHASGEHAEDWRRAAAEPVLIGTLRGKDPGAQLAWVRKHRMYYAPMTRKQRRQFVARWIGLYTPAPLRADGIGAVTHVAEVRSIEVKRRGDIDTSWEPTRGKNETVLVFHLVAAPEERPPIRNVEAQRVPARMWSSRLAMERAVHLAHLALETEPEWRLVEALTAGGVAHEVVPGPARVEDPEDPRGRARFVGEGWTVRYAGASGFRLVVRGKVRWIARVEEVVAAVRG